MDTPKRSEGMGSGLDGDWQVSTSLPRLERAKACTKQSRAINGKNSPRVRAVLDLREKKYSSREIADLLDISAHHVQVIISNARRHGYIKYTRSRKGIELSQEAYLIMRNLARRENLSVESYVLDHLSKELRKCK
jgi:predicted transcriptional regulator